MTFQRRAPLAHQVAHELRARIESGEFLSTRYLPSINKLADDMGVSRVTMASALELLRDEGLIETRQGAGTSMTRAAAARAREQVDPAENFEAWLRLATLPSHFPQLSSLTWDALSGDPDKDQKIYLRPQQSRLLEQQILPAASAAPNVRPRVGVVFRRGHGATTIWNYIFNLYSPQADRRRSAAPLPTIPVRISWRRIGSDPAKSRLTLEAALREDVLHTLLRPEWENMIDEGFFGDLTGAITPETLDPDTAAHRRRLLVAIGGKGDRPPIAPIDPDPPSLPSRELRELAPLLSEGRAADLFSGLAKAGVKTLLLIDLSGNTPTGNATSDIKAFVGAIKDIREDADTMPRPVNLTEMYFLDRPTLEVMTRVLERSVHEIVFPHYAKPDFFGILTRHYPILVEVIGGDTTRSYATRDVVAIIRAPFFDEFARRLADEGLDWGDIGLEELAERMRDHIVNHEMAQPWGNISLHLGGS